MSALQKKKEAKKAAQAAKKASDEERENRKDPLFVYPQVLSLVQRLACPVIGAWAGLWKEREPIKMAFRGIQQST